MAEEKKAEPAAPKEPELSPEERHKRKEVGRADIIELSLPASNY
jgi:hypothetical protein